MARQRRCCVANVSLWARHCRQAHQYLLDAVGHGLDDYRAKQCLALAESELSSAERSAQKGNRDELDHVDRLRNMLGQYNLGAMKN